MVAVRWLLAMPVAFVAAVLAAPADASSVRDNGKIFSKEAVRKAEARLDSLERTTHIPVVIETIPEMAELDRDATQATRRKALDALAVHRDEAIREVGVYILISKREHLISHVLVRKRYAGLVPIEKRDAIRTAFIAEFKQKDFDGGLTRAVETIEQSLRGASGRGRAETAQKTHAADPASPQDVVRVATEAINHGRIEEFASAMHPDALHQFRTVMLELADAAARDGKAGEILRLFREAKNVQELKKLDEASFFASYLRGVMRYDTELKSALADAKIATLGHVNEGKEIAHVVYRITTKFKDSDPIEMVTVTSLRTDGPRWAMLLSGDVEMMTIALKQRLSGKPAVPDPKMVKIEPLGQVLEANDRSHLVYRTATPLGSTSIKKINLLSIESTDPGWKVLQAGDSAAIIKLIKASLGL
jgi:uncharacterized membrane protein YgcG